MSKSARLEEGTLRERVSLFRNAFRPLKKEPPHFQLLGTGVILLGSIGDRAFPYRITILWLTVIFVPIIPLRAYAKFRGKTVGSLSFATVKRLYGWRLAWYYLRVWLESIWRAAIILTIIASLIGAWWYFRGGF